MKVRRHHLTVPRISMSFAEAVRRAGPSTSCLSPAQKEGARARGEIWCDSLIWQAERMYRYIHNPASGEVALTLINFGPQSKTAGPTAVLFAQCEGLQPATPFEVFAVGIAKPTLSQELGADPAGILSPESQMFDGVNRACCVWLGSAQRECAYVPFDYPLHDSYWFAFTKRA